MTLVMPVPLSNSGTMLTCGYLPNILFLCRDSLCGWMREEWRKSKEKRRRRYLLEKTKRNRDIGMKQGDSQRFYHAGCKNTSIRLEKNDLQSNFVE